MKEDELQFHYPLDRRILKEAENHLHDEGFVSERYFLTHPDPEISKQAAELASDRYQLSKYHSKGQAIITDEERLYELVPRLLIDFKLSIVEEEMKHTLQALANPDIYNNPEKCQEIMQHYKELQKFRFQWHKKQATASFYVSYFPSPHYDKRGNSLFHINILHESGS